MKEHFGALARRRFDTRIGVRPIKAMDALRNIVHGHTGAATLGRAGVGTGRALVKQSGGGTLIHAHAIIGHGNQDCILAVLVNGHVDPQGVVIAHTMTYGVLDNRLDHERRHQRIFHVLGHIERRKHAVLAKAGLLKGKVALGLCNLARDRNKRSRVVERGTIER